MLKGSLWDKILIFTLPIAASSILQQLFNSADLAVAGRFAGSQALAAVGSNSQVISIIINVFLGLSVGANVVIGNFIGEGKLKNIQDAVHTAIAVSLISGFALIFVGFFLARPILTAMGTPDDVLESAILYLRIYFAGMPFIMIYNFASAVLRSKGDTLRPLLALLLGGALNVVLNLVFVIVFKMAVSGVAVATLISNAVSGTIVTVCLMKEKGELHLDFKKLHINRHYLIMMIKIGVPSGLQGMVFNLSNIIIQSSINSFGSSAMAGSASGQLYEFYTFYVVGAFNQAVVSFTSQNIGAKNFKRCKEVFRYCWFYSVIIMAVMVSVFIIFKEFFIGVCTKDPLAIKYGIIRLLVVETFDCLICNYELSASALRAMGYSMLPAIETIFGVCVIRIIWVLTVFAHYKAILAPEQAFAVLMAVYPVSWLITGPMVMGTYHVLRKKVFKAQS
jgi:putative MATE family efflux protein